MKNHTAEERIEARKKLPKPLSDYLASETITETYSGLLEKHRLNFRQIELLSEVVNVTLEGLEPESALEANLHQALPEIPNATMRELMLDINDRIFKEAARRIKENIVAPDTWDTEVLGPKPTEEELHREALRKSAEEKNDDDPAVIAEDEKALDEAIAAQKIELARINAELAKDEKRWEKEAEMGEVAQTYEGEGTTPAIARPSTTPQTSAVPPAPIIPQPSVVEKKMSATQAGKSVEVPAVSKLPDIPKSVPKNIQQSAPITSPAPPQSNEKKVDPYREAVE